ncbi:MAG: undecaprenyl/decaprenyl-phosphate alpha-N-acetylglucosaminyl 1-phosphate transferase, partial [Chloroflexi bacterium]|nr:undecaprenyl/decaprenyl-phosphate alpha-N-acetylglucosaminyl 1-phosphate transferase [Chloroflexota bacterium]
MVKTDLGAGKRVGIQVAVLVASLALVLFLVVAVALGKPGHPTARQVFPLGAAFLIALAISYAVTPLVARFARRYGFKDRPSSHHLPPMKPRLGGLAIYLAFLLGVLATMPLLPDRTPEEMRRIWGILAGSTLLLAMGIVDDRRELGPFPQLTVQVLAALIAMSLGVVIHAIPNPFGNPFSRSTIEFSIYLAVPFTLFWIVGAVNTVDFIDGLDGLAVGVGGIAAIVLYLHSFHLMQY